MRTATAVELAGVVGLSDGAESSGECGARLAIGGGVLPWHGDLALRIRDGVGVDFLPGGLAMRLGRAGELSLASGLRAAWPSGWGDLSIPARLSIELPARTRPPLWPHDGRLGDPRPRAADADTRRRHHRIGGRRASRQRPVVLEPRQRRLRALRWGDVVADRRDRQLERRARPSSVWARLSACSPFCPRSFFVLA
jgi:hypothetical protein